MPLRDYAIVVGIGTYPNFGPGDTPLDLHGPVADAEAVAAWLLDPDKGGLPDVERILRPMVMPANRRAIRSISRWESSTISPARRSPADAAA